MINFLSLALLFPFFCLLDVLFALVLTQVSACYDRVFSPVHALAMYLVPCGCCMAWLPTTVRSRFLSGRPAVSDPIVLP